MLKTTFHIAAVALGVTVAGLFSGCATTGAGEKSMAAANTTPAQGAAGGHSTLNGVQKPQRTDPAAMFAYTTQPPQNAGELREKYGIEVIGARLSSVGHMIDFRYRVVEPSKAKPVFDRNVKPFLTHRKTGYHLVVPVPAKVGPLRAYGEIKKRNYFIMFGNNNLLVKTGDVVDIIIGDVKINGLVVE